MLSRRMPERRAIAVVGEALIDLVAVDRAGLFEARPGGSPANVAVGLARLEVPVKLAARLSYDLFGRQLRRHLIDNNVDLSCAPDAREPTSLAVVSVGPDGGPEYDFRVTGTADWCWSDSELAGLVDDDVVALHTGSLSPVLPPGNEALRRLVMRTEPSTTISYDPNCRPALMGSAGHVRGRIEELVGLSDVVKASAEDLAWLYAGQAAADVAATWLAMGASLVAVTLGSDGVSAVAASTGPLTRPGRKVDVLDTVGAGDAFVSALLAGLYQRDLLGQGRRAALHDIGSTTLAQVLDEAVLASALTVTRRGADPPTLKELREHL